MTATEERRWKPATFNRYCAFFSVAYRLGLESGKIKSNPVRTIRHCQENNGRVRWLDEVEEARPRAVIEERYPEQLPAFDLALHTGMRKSEQYSLTWDCVDFDRRQLIIPLSKHSEIRYIPLDDTAVRALQTLRERSSGAGPVMVASKNGYGIRSGHALKTPREWFTTACRVANIQNFTWHCLRHTFASRLTMAGVGLRDVQELMGHKAIAMTCRYSHLAPDHQLDALRRLDRWTAARQGVQEEPSDTGLSEHLEASSA